MTETKTTTARTTAAKVPAIYAAIAAIQSEVGNIPKNGKGPSSQGGYAFVSNEDILLKVRDLMIEHGVIVRPTTLSSTSGSREIGANRSLAVVEVEVEFEYIATADGSTYTVVVRGEGADNSDKGYRKAYTQAQKVANLLTFSIATGEPDPDGLDTQAVSAAAPAQAQKQQNQKIEAARGESASGVFNQIKAFLGANKLEGEVANKLGNRFSEGKPAAEWTQDVEVLKSILKALQNGEVE